MATEETLDPSLQDSEKDDLETLPEQTDESQKETPPPETDWQKRYADLRKDYDKIAAQKKEKAKDSEEKPKPTKVDETDFKIFNADRIKLCRPEFEELRAEGLSYEKALEYAELKKGIRYDPSEANRQATMANAPDYVSRSGEAPVRLTEYDKRFGLTAERKKELKAKYGEHLDD